MKEKPASFRSLFTALLRNIYVCLVPILYIHCSQAERLFLYRFKSVIKGKKERDGREKKHKNFHLIYACQRKGTTTTTGLILNDVDISRRRARRKKAIGLFPLEKLPRNTSIGGLL